ncbi:MAG TPA: asparagine synthase-related protein [Gemmatimonadaceae bacterium]|nr:asparagine synthase-related protein [Gemmatimonadaceae bacterium]
MSGIAGVFGTSLDEAGKALLLSRLESRGADRSMIRRLDDATLVVTRHEWESEGDTRVLDDGIVTLVADASIYYRDDLRRKLAAHGMRLPNAATASDAVLAAYRAWGEHAPRELEGDFAFVLWDRARRRALCSRDLGGKRPLHYSVVGESLVVGSTATAVASVPNVDARLNRAVLAETCAQFWSGGGDTCYVGVRELAAGETLIWSPERGARIERHWEVPEIGTAPHGDLQADAEQLRALLKRAASERLAKEGPTAVWMSGGWDSSSVFAAGQDALREARGPQSLMPVSISYPKGDPGREDELIASIADRWKASVHWLDVDRIPLFERPEDRAAERDLPAAHTYEHWNRALAYASRATGARVAFDGNGGDQLFQISDIFLSDLFRAGRWASVAKEWREKGGRGLGTFFDWVIAPAVPDPVKSPLVRLLGRRAADDFTRPTPAWIRSDFAARHHLVERDRSHMTWRAGYRGWRREAHFFLSAPVFPRAFRCLSDFALDAGVELRSPLYDRRVIEFACTRPRQERNAGAETKRLLRESMRGLLPDEVLAPRPRRTGITTAYSDRRMLQEFPLLLERHGKMQMLADLGIVEPKVVQSSWEEYRRTGNVAIKIPLFLTMQVELWLRGRAVEHAPATRALGTSRDREEISALQS